MVINWHTVLLWTYSQWVVEMTKSTFSGSMVSGFLVLPLENLLYRSAVYTGNLLVSHTFTSGTDIAPDPEKT